MTSKFITSLLIGTGALVVLGSTPAEAKAQYMRPRGYQYQAAIQNAYLHYNFNPYYSRATIYGPATYQTWNMPYYQGRAWTTPGQLTWTYSPLYGAGWWYTTPTIYGWNNSAYYGYQPYVIPGATIPLSYFSGYVPPDYYLP
jgi:hypothetical protein